MIQKLSLFLFLISTSFYAQELRVIDTVDFELRKKLIKSYKKENTLFYSNLKKEHRGKLRKELINIYKESHEEFLKNIRKKRFILDKRFTKYTDSIASIINKKAMLKEHQMAIYVSKNPQINALNIGNGIVILNIGLFKYFKNEAQLIAVLTHEIAHEKLQHVANTIMHTAEMRTSKAYKLQAKNIRYQKYNQYNKSFKILKELMYTDSNLKRKREMQADSVGYILYKKTTLNRLDYISALEFLAKNETLPSIALDSSIYKQFFNLPAQKFKNEWLKMESYKNYDYSQYTEKINTDSVKSHPEITQRILKLKKDFPELNSKDTISIINEGATFLKLQKLAKKEAIINYYDLEEYGKSIQLILYKLSENPQDIFLRKWLGKNFKKLYEAKKKYQLNRYIDRINPKEQSHKYQQFISFIWNLNLSEIKNIGDYYTEN